MHNLSTMKKKLLAGLAVVNFVLMLGCFAGTSQAAIIKVAIDDSFQSNGSLNYFNGRLLSADDLTREQEYSRPDQHLLNADSSGVLVAFEPGDVRIPFVFSFLWGGDTPPQAAPVDPTRPNADDFIWLDTATTWHGNLWITQLGGIYEVRGTYAASVPEPATMLLFGSGLAGLGLLRKRFKM